MSVFSPRRYQAAYQPYQRQSAPIRAFTTFERWIKSALFSCSMCGNCILQETALVCPMTCPKGLRNGLCGGATPDECEVDASRPCTWYVIYERAEKRGIEHKLLEINAPMDGAKTGQETWIDMIKLWRERDQGPHPLEYFSDRETFNKEWDSFFYDFTTAEVVARGFRIPSPSLRRTCIRIGSQPPHRRFYCHGGNSATTWGIGCYHP